MSYIIYIYHKAALILRGCADLLQRPPMVAVQHIHLRDIFSSLSLFGYELGTRVT